MPITESAKGYLRWPVRKQGQKQGRQLSSLGKKKNHTKSLVHIFRCDLSRQNPRQQRTAPGSHGRRGTGHSHTNACVATPGPASRTGSQTCPLRLREGAALHGRQGRLAVRRGPPEPPAPHWLQLSWKRRGSASRAVRSTTVGRPVTLPWTDVPCFRQIKCRWWKALVYHLPVSAMGTSKNKMPFWYTYISLYSFLFFNKATNTELLNRRLRLQAEDKFVRFRVYELFREHDEWNFLHIDDEAEVQAFQDENESVV